MSICETDVEKIDMSNAAKVRLKQTIRQNNEAVKAFGDLLDGKAPPVGHNTYGVAGVQLRTIVQRIERLEEEKAGLLADIRDVYAEAKGNGFDVKIIRKIIQLRRMDAADREEQEQALHVYKQALGMVPQLDMFTGDGAAEVVA